MNTLNCNYGAYSPRDEQGMKDSIIEETEKLTGKLGRTIFWTSIGLAVVMGAIVTGLELRARRLRNRTPYDSYSHAGDSLNGSTEYGVGI